MFLVSRTGSRLLKTFQPIYLSNTTHDYLLVDQKGGNCKLCLSQGQYLRLNHFMEVTEEETPGLFTVMF